MPRVEPFDAHAASQSGQEMHLIRVRLGPSLNYGVGAARRGEERLEPVRRRAAVVVGEGDHARCRRAPAVIPLRCRAANRSDEESDPEPIRGGGERSLLPRRADDQDLELARVQRLLRERRQGESQARLAAERRYHHGDTRRGHGGGI